MGKSTEVICDDFSSFSSVLYISGNFVYLNGSVIISYLRRALDI